MVPKPVKAVILLFPISKELEAERIAEDARLEKDDQPCIDPTIFWIKQTVCFVSLWCC
jgi:ubiquitin carboxyl-terminal hydrolase L3